MSLSSPKHGQVPPAGASGGISAAEPADNSLKRRLRQVYRYAYWWLTNRRLLAPLRGVRTVVAFGESVGDNLLCANVLGALHAQGAGPLAFLTPYPELFAGLSFPLQCHLFDPAVLAAVRRAGPRLVMPQYSQYDATIDRHEPPPREHLIVELCRSAGITGSVELKPLLTMTDAERESGRRHAANHILIQSSNRGARMPARNKDWPPDRWQEVVDKLTPFHTITQVGGPDDPLLQGVNDCRGIGFRATAGLLSAARLYLGGEGAVMHLARAVDCRAVIVLGGRTAPHQTCYPENSNLFTAMPCAPCWQMNTCQHDRECLHAITPSQVLAAVSEQLRLPPLSGPGRQVSI